MLKFPVGFYWGSATSAHQVEGGNVNDWSEWEEKNAERLARQAGKKWKVWQQKKFPEMFNPENYISGQACNHYHLYGKDFDIAKSLGHNAHRFSIEWSRVEPEEGKFNEKEIRHYRQVISALKKRGLEPFVTLYHWTMPVWLAQKGGWLNPKTPYYFDRYAKIISKNLFDCVKFWITINEPNVYTIMSYLGGFWPPQEKNIFKYFKVLNSLAESHQLVYKSLRLVDLDCQVGIAKNNWYFKNIPFAKYFRNEYFLKKIRDYQDFIGLNYYKSFVFPKRNFPVSDLNRKIYPKGIYYILKDLKKYQKPIYITENGVADAEDEKRTEFIREHLKWIHKSIQEGIDVRGYFYWSLLDNFEWDKGFWPRFGLVEMDYKTMERKIRPSAREYAEICKENKIIN